MNAVILMCILGVITHYLMEFMDERAKSAEFSPFTYLADRPYRSLLSIVGAAVGFLVLDSTGQLSMVTAFAAGYMCDSGAQRIASMAQAVVDR